MIKKTWGLDEQMDAAIDGLFEEQEMTEHTLPLELISHSGGTYIIDADGEIFNDDAFTVTACNCHGKLLEALAEHSLYYLDPAGNELFDQPLNWEAKLLHEIRKAEEQS